jgi:hypothetical protein
MREKFVVNGLSFLNRPSPHLANEKPYVAIVTFMARQGGAACPELHREKIGGSWDGNANTFPKFVTGEQSLGLLLS